MRLIGYAKALYSTWVYAETLRLLLDAGEGLNTHLEGRLLGIRDIALTHGHTDHYTGLHNILITRLRIHQESEPLEPLRIVWPAGEPELEGYLAYLRTALLDRHPYLADLTPLAPGERVTLGAVRGLTLEPFAVQHRGPHACYGYRVLQERWQLKPELRELPQPELNRRAASAGREAIAQRVELPLIVFSGDSRPLPVDEARGAELLVHESTFVGERLDDSHSTLEEALAVWRASGARRLLLYHFSSRYRAGDVAAALDAQLNEAERPRMDFIAPGSLFDASFRMAGL